MEPTTEAAAAAAAQPELAIPSAPPALKMTITRDALINELAFMHNIVSNDRLGLPVLSFVRIEATGKGADGKLTLQATDLERSLTSTIPAMIESEGVVAIQAHKLFDYAKLLNAGNVTFTALENGWVSLTSGRSRTKMTGVGVGSFPQLPATGEGAKISLPPDALRQMIARTLFAVSTEESRYTLRGAMFEFSNEQLVMVSTDGHRLSYFERAEKTAGAGKASSTLIPLAALRDLGALLDRTDAGEVEFSQNDSTLFFTLGDRRYSVRKLMGQFPNYKQVIPKGNDKSVVISVADFEQAVRRVMQFADERSGAVRFALGENSLKLSASTDDNGQTEETMEVVYHGEPLVVGLSGFYLLDYLKSIGGKGEVRVEFKDANSSVMLKREGETDADAFALQMPMRA